MLSHFAHCAVPCERGLKLTSVKGELRVFGFGRVVEVRLTFPPRINAREIKKMLAFTRDGRALPALAL
jgi:hypothetical protein